MPIEDPAAAPPWAWTPPPEWAAGVDPTVDPGFVQSPLDVAPPVAAELVPPTAAQPTVPVGEPTPVPPDAQQAQSFESTPVPSSDGLQAPPASWSSLPSEHEAPPPTPATFMQSIGDKYGKPPAPPDIEFSRPAETVANADPEYWTHLAETDPEAYATQTRLAEQAANDEFLKGKADIIRKDREQSESDNRAHAVAAEESRKASAQLEIDAKQLADTKVDPEKWWHDRSTGQKIAGFISAIVGGLAQSAAGGTGRNVGLDMINGAIEQDIAAQVANLQNKRGDISRRQGVVAEMYARTGDLDRSMEAARRASHEQAMRELEIKMQQFDPSGTTARAIAKDVMIGRASEAAAQQKRAAEDEKRRFEAAKILQDEARIKEENRYHKATVGVDYSRLAQQKKEFKENHDLALANLGLEQDKLKVEADKLKAAGKTKEADALSERGVGGQLVPTGEVDESGAPAMKYDVLRQADGSPFTVGTKEEAILFRKKKAAVDTITSLMDETIKMVKENGWESDFVQSPAWQKMKANWSTIMVKQKDFQDLGAITESDAKLIGGLMGAKDPTQLRSPIVGMEKAFDNTVGQFNKDMRSIQYTGSDYAPVKSWELKGAPTTPEDEAFKKSLKRPAPTSEEWQAQEDRRRLSSDPYSAPATPTAAATSQSEMIHSLVNTMTDASLPQASRDAARARLEKGAEAGQSPEIRDAYTSALMGALGSTIPMSKD